MRRSGPAALRILASCLLVTGVVTVAQPASATRLDASEPVARPAFAVLIGQPRAPGLERLSAVETDVAMMHAFFGALAPEQTWVHLPPGPIRRSLVGDQTTARAPDWPALIVSVTELRDRLEQLDGPADVYVYYAGHGKRRRVSSYTYTDLFLEPVAGVEGPGFDGVLSTKLLQDQVLGPLSERDDVRVHLVVDACQSAYLVEARGMRRTARVRKMLPAVLPEMRDEFVSDFPRVGALLATNSSQVTYEDTAVGGLFSYAVRSAGIGAADRDRDGRITYREVARVLPWILGRRSGGSRPGILPPGDALDETFVDYRGRPVAAVRFAPPVATRYELHSSWYAPYALVYPGTGREALARLPEAGEFIAAERRAVHGPRQWYRFQAANRSFSELQRPFAGPGRVGRGDARFVDEVYPEGPEVMGELTVVEEPRWVWQPSGFSLLGVSATGGMFPAGDDIGGAGVSAMGVEVAGAFGAGQDMFSWRLGWSRQTTVRPNAGKAGLTDEQIALYPNEYRRADVPRVAVGYDRVLDENALFEVAAGLFGGGGLLLERRSSVRDYSQSPLYDGLLVDAGGSLTGRALIRDSAWAVRADARLGAQWILSETDDWVDVVATVAIGVEYEFALAD